MSEIRILRDSRAVSVTVGTAADASSSLRGDSFAQAGVVIGGVTASATLTVWASADGLTYAPLYSADGVAATVSIPADGGSVALPDSLFGVPFAKLVSDSELGTAATAVVVLKS
jgi:hypothetical protein